jgi:hypothetical protein
MTARRWGAPRWQPSYSPLRPSGRRRRVGVPKPNEPGPARASRPTSPGLSAPQGRRGDARQPRQSPEQPRSPGLSAPQGQRGDARQPWQSPEQPR